MQADVTGDDFLTSDRPLAGLVVSAKNRVDLARVSASALRFLSSFAIRKDTSVRKASPTYLTGAHHFLFVHFVKRTTKQIVAGTKKRRALSRRTLVRMEKW